MEVHHHSHTPDNYRERKKWTHYFWEFLMLFLAVTLGFFVENQREHYIEQKREKQFIQSLFNDIKTDTINLAKIINARTIKEQSLDSLTYLMNNKGSDTRRIYFHAVSAPRTFNYRFVPNDGTIQQLKNSGAFRLIRKRTVVDSIAKYDVNVRNIVGQWMVEESLLEYYRTAASKIFDGIVFGEMLDADANIVRLPAEYPALQPFNEKELYEWNYRLSSVKTINKANRRDMRAILKQAQSLLMLLKKEYHLE